MTYDLVVIGGGPAGCAAALTAARSGARVLLLERGRYPRQKVCGEFVSPESLSLLTSLLLEEDRERLLASAPQIPHARVFVDDLTVRTIISPPAISISRYALDSALWRACEAAGVDARLQITVERVESTSGGALLRVAGQDEGFDALGVIDASGRSSNLVRARSGPPRSGPGWLGLKAHFVEDNAPQSVDVYFFEGGYCGVQPVGAGIVNACAMVRSDIATSLETALEQSPALRLRSRNWQRHTDAVSTFPLVFRPPSSDHDGVLHAGDAAGFIDPFVGDGISLALATGLAAAQALGGVWTAQYGITRAAELYRDEYERRFAPALRNAARIRWLLALPRPLRRIAGRIATVPAISKRFIKLTRAA